MGHTLFSLHFRLCKSGNTLKQFKLRKLSSSIITVYLDLIAQLKQKICKTSVCTETNDTGAALSGATQDIHQFQLICTLINTIYLHLIDSIIYCTKIFIIRSGTYTVYMRTEIALCHASQSSMENTVHNTAKASIPMCMHNSHLTVMISCHIKISAIYISSQETTSHTINTNAVDTLQITILISFKYSNTFIFNRVEIFTVLRHCCIRCIADFYFTALCESSLFQIHIIHLDSLTGPVSIGTYVSHIFFPHSSSPPVVSFSKLRISFSYPAFLIIAHHLPDHKRFCPFSRTHHSSYSSSLLAISSRSAWIFSRTALVFFWLIFPAVRPTTVLSFIQIPGK